MGGGARGGNGGEIGHAMGERIPADIVAVSDRLGAMGRIDHQLNIAGADGIDAMRPAFQYLIDGI